MKRSIIILGVLSGISMPAPAEFLSECEFTIYSDGGDWGSSFNAYLDDSANDTYVVDEDYESIVPPGRGVAMESWVDYHYLSLDARDGLGGQEWWGGGPSGPDIPSTLYLCSYGASGTVSATITWDLSEAHGWIYVLYDDDNTVAIILRPGGEYVVDVPFPLCNVGLRLRAEVDCNGNEIPDTCDIDCGDPGGACDVAGCGLSEDCNENGVPDECDIADGTSQDCNGNGVPDECEENLLVNPGFETYDLAGWTTWGQVDGVQESGQWFGSIPAHCGDYFLGTASCWGVKNGGVYQQVSVMPNSKYDLSCWYYIYWMGGSSSSRECWLGVDLSGGTDPYSAGITWEGPGIEPNPYGGAWRELQMTNIQTGSATTITVFLKHVQYEIEEWNINCFDDTSVYHRVKADFDRDGDVDTDDYMVFEACATGPAVPYDPEALPPDCTLVPDGNGIIAADFDEDSDVDHSDFAVFQRCYSGEGNPADPNCAD